MGLLLAPAATSADFSTSKFGPTHRGPLFCFALRCTSISFHNFFFIVIAFFFVMSAAKVRRMSPSSVAQDWVDRFGRGKGPETTFPFPNELPDHFPSPIYTSFNEKAIPLPTRDVRNSPISTASNLSQSSEPNSSSKCRQLPCRTFVSTGSCPYGDRCVFLHDPLIVSKPVFIKIKVCQ